MVSTSWIVTGSKGIGAVGWELSSRRGFEKEEKAENMVLPVIRVNVSVSLLSLKAKQ